MPCNLGQSYRQRVIIREALPGGEACNSSQLLETVGCNLDVNCSCAILTTPTDCTRDALCQWLQNECKDSGAFSTCQDIADPTQCNETTGCVWNDLGFCEAVPQSFLDYFEGAAALLGASAPAASCLPNQTFVNASTISGLAYHPGNPVRIFPTVLVSDAMGLIDGAVVSIESGYSKGMDQIILPEKFVPSKSSGITVLFKPNRGIFMMLGTASPSAFAQIISNLYFATSSASPAPRVITWNLGLDMFVSSQSKHAYYYNISVGPISWLSAQAACASSTWLGAPGYLASISTKPENDIITIKLAVQAWIGASDSQQAGLWRWTTGPESTQNTSGLIFWEGPNAAYTGTPVDGLFADWEPPGLSVVQGEPSGLPGTDYVLSKINGYWVTRANADVAVDAFVCEYGDAQHAISNLVWSSVMVQQVGCIDTVSPVAMDCSRRDSTWCNVTSECKWNYTKCIEGCTYLSDPSDCTARLDCHFDYDSVPSICTWNVCAGTKCDDPRCTLAQDGSCTYSTQCARFNNPETGGAAACGLDIRCSWNGTACNSVQLCPTYMKSGSCQSDACQALCTSDPSCDYVANETTSMCLVKTCDSLSPLDQCDGSHCDKRLKVPGIKSFRAGDAPIPIFTSATNVQSCPYGFTVFIETGFSVGDSLVFFSTSNPLFVGSYDAIHGVMTVVATKSVDGPTFNAALQSVYFATSSNNGLNRTFSWTLIGSPQLATYGPVFLSTLRAPMYVEFISSVAVSYTLASQLCSSRSLNGISGSLASFTTAAEEAAVVNAVGSTTTGWIGAKGIYSSAGSIWFWDANTSASNTVFYRGSAGIGQTATYAHWSGGQPSAVPIGSIRYGALSGANNLWTAYTASTTLVGGYYCTYTPSSVSTQSGSVVYQAVGCIQKICSYANADACVLDKMCVFNVDTGCIQSPCAGRNTVESCGSVGGCYYDPSTNLCLVNSADVCAKFSVPTCSTGGTSCGVLGGFCGTVGCSKYPDSTSCNNDAACMSSDGNCVSSKCGYVAQQLCVGDSTCQWLNNMCTTAVCVGLNNSGTCAGTAGCQWTDGAIPPCSVTSCPYTNAPMCTSDTTCLWSNGTCVRNTCPTLVKAQCEAKSDICSWQDSLSVCQNKMCSASDAATCLGITTTDPAFTKDPTKPVSLCQWPNDQTGCIPQGMSFMASLAAAVSTPPVQCTTVTPDRSVILIALVVIAVVLLLAAGWIIKAQHANAADNSMDFSERMYDDEDEDELSDVEPTDTIQDNAITRRNHLDDI